MEYNSIATHATGPASSTTHLVGTWSTGRERNVRIRELGRFWLDPVCPSDISRYFPLAVKEPRDKSALEQVTRSGSTQKKSVTFGIFCVALTDLLVIYCSKLTPFGLEWGSLRWSGKNKVFESRSYFTSRGVP
jgi:hypothetical protein